MIYLAQLVYESAKNRDGRGCGEDEESRGKCRQGDLGGKFGKVRVGRRESMFTKAYHTDLDLELPDLDGTRSLYVAIYDAEHPDRFEIQISSFPAKSTNESHIDLQISDAGLVNLCLLSRDGCES